MKFTVTEVKENEDGSANAILNLDNEAREYLLNYAFIHMLKEALAEGKTYSVEEKDVRTSV
jgi:hypothetical protein